MAKSSAIHAEWIGKQASVLAAKNPSLVGLSGKVIDETKHFIVLETVQGAKRVPKTGTTFKVVLEGSPHIVPGEEILAAPEERIKLKAKQRGNNQR